jgi:hypothetical protein
MAFLTKKCNVRRFVCGTAFMILLAIAGGLILWRFLPDKKKEVVAGIADNGFHLRPDPTRQAPPPSYQFVQCADPTGPDCCNGLSNTCDLRVDEIMYAGIHNAQSSVQNGFRFAPNHQYDAISALDYGYRLINFDLGVCSMGLALVHGLCKLGTIDPKDIFQRLHEWLNEHPNEVVLIPIQITNEAGGGAVDLGKFYNLLDTIDGFTDRLYTKPIGELWPTLRELIQWDQRVLIFHYNGPTCVLPEVQCPPGLDNDWFRYAAETPFSFTSINDLNNEANSCKVTRGRVNNPFFALNAFLSVPDPSVQVNQINKKEYLQQHIQSCSELNGGRTVTTVFIDFWESSDLPEVVQLHNSRLVAKNTTQTGKRLI